MNSKEALKLAILEYEKDLEFDENNQWVKNVLKGLKECQQDLDRLEKLETGNAKLKKVIEILKDELEISFEDTTQYGNGYWAVLKNWSGEEEVVINFNTPNNYELLKEVLEDE